MQSESLKQDAGHLKVYSPVARELILFQLEYKAKISHWLQSEPAGLKDSHDFTN